MNVDTAQWAPGIEAPYHPAIEFWTESGGWIALALLVVGLGASLLLWAREDITDRQHSRKTRLAPVVAFITLIVVSLGSAFWGILFLQQFAAGPRCNAEPLLESLTESNDLEDPTFLRHGERDDHVFCGSVFGDAVSEGAPLFEGKHDEVTVRVRAAFDPVRPTVTDLEVVEV